MMGYIVQIYKQRLNKIIFSEIGRLYFFAMVQSRSKNLADENRVGILKVFQLSNHHHCKIRQLPLLFLVRVQKGTKPSYYKYVTLRQDYPMLLLQYFESHAKISDINTPNLFYDGVDNERRETQDREAEEEIARLERINQKLENEIEDMRNSYEKKIKQLNAKIETSKKIKEEIIIKNIVIKEPQVEKQKPNKQTFINSSTESRPVRSCRIKGKIMGEKPSVEARNESESEESVQPQRDEKQSNQSSEDSIQRRKNPKFPKISGNKIKILDYDDLIQRQTGQFLITPAVMPTIKSRSEHIPAYQIAPIIDFKVLEREVYESQGERQSESSYCLEQKSRDKKRHLRWQKEQERNMMRPNKKKKPKRKPISK